MMPHPKFKAAVLAMILIESLCACACTVIVVGRNASTDGSAIASQTADGVFDANITVIKGQEFPPGAIAGVYWNITGQSPDPPVKIAEIPQVRQTYTYFHVGYPFMNEHQLALGESTICQQQRLRAAWSRKAVLTIEQLQVFALQRTRTARAAIRTMGALAEKYGFLDSYEHQAESLAVVDGTECWLFEIFGVGSDWDPGSGKPGAVWAARRVPDDHVFCMPNISRIREIDLDNPDYFMACRNYRQTAIEKGLYDPASGRPFIWQEAYSPHEGHWSLKSPWIRNRLYMFYRTVAPSGNWPVDKPVTEYPFSIKPERKMKVQDVIRLMRSTYKGTPLDTEADPAWHKSRLATPFPSSELQELLKVKYNRGIAVRGCSYGFVSQSRPWLPDPVGGLAWFYFDNPHTSCYVPIYAGVERFPDSWQTYDRTRFSRRSARWAFAQMDNLVNHRYQDIIKDLRSIRDPLEAEFFAGQPAIEAEALEVYKRSPLEAGEFLTDYTNRCMERAETAYWDLIDVLIAKYDDK